MKKALLILALICSCLLLTGCYTETDPWPEADLGDGQATAAPVATPVPGTQTEQPETRLEDEQATAIPYATPVPTQEPLPDDAVDVSPNFNG